MNKIISFIICIVMVFTLSVTAFAGTKSSDKDNGNSLGDLVSSVLGSLSDLAGDLSDTLSDAAEEAGDAISGIADGAGDVLSDAADELQDVLPEAANEIKDALSDSGEDLEVSLNDLLGSLSGLLSGLSDTLNDAGISIEISGDLDDLIEDLGDLEGIDLDDIDLGELYDNDDIDEEDDEDGFAGRPAKIAGGWSVNDEAQVTITDDEAAIFDAAIEGLLGVTYTPVAVLATQLVAGTNYAFLCTGTTVIPNATPQWYVVTVYVDLQGNAAVISIEDIELDDIEEEDDIDDDQKVGAWKITEPEEPAELPENAQAAFEKAADAYLGVNYSPIALLGTQIVAGTNYKVLCYGTTATKNPITSLYVIDIYEDLDGEAVISSAALFDLTEYIDN